MIKKILLIILFSSVLFGQTIRYYSPDGANTDGESWATAWNATGSIQWSDLSGGGYLLFDGNAAGDSVVYDITIDPEASGSWGSYIYIMPAKFYYEGSQPDSVKGKVVINHYAAGTSRSMLVAAGTGNEWIYFKGFIGRNIEYRALYVGAGGPAAHIVFDSCEVWSTNNDDPLDIMGDRSNANLQDSTTIPHHIEIKYCTLITNDNLNTPQEEDVCYIDCAGDIWIHHNIFWERNNHECSSGDCPHVDNIQTAFGAYGLKIYNNIFIKDSCVSGANMILGIKSRYASYGDTCVVYNNYMYTGGMDGCGSNWTQQILWRAPETIGSDYVALVYSINNTLVASNDASGNSCAEGHYNPLESNNIFVQWGVNGAEPTILPSTMAQWYSTYSSGDLKYVDSMHTNLAWQAWDGSASFGGNRWRWGSTTGSIDDGGGWSDWVSKGGDGVNDDPDFVNDYRWYNTAPYEISATSPAIDAGTDMTYILQAFEYLPDFDASTDILGNERDGSWDIGAFEYQGDIADTTAIVGFTPVTGAALISYHTK